MAKETPFSDHKVEVEVKKTRTRWITDKTSSVDKGIDLVDTERIKDDYMTS